MKSMTKVLAVLVFAGWAGSVSAEPITYEVNHTIGSGSVVGAIETDGTIGVLTTANIVSWSFTLTSPNLANGPSDTISSSSPNGRVNIGGGFLTATTGQLTADWTAGTNFYAIFQDVSSARSWCLTAGPSACSDQPTPSDGIYRGDSTPFAEQRHPTGPEVIGTAEAVAAGPITDTVVVEDRQWAQPDLFTNLSWDDINAVCPSGVCINGGTLNGFEVTNWVWASPDDVNALFNLYIGSYDMGPGPDSNSNSFDDGAFLFFLDGWRPTTDDAVQTETRGWLNELSKPDEAYQGGARTETGLSYLDTNLDLSQSTGTADAGAWFYRPRPTQPITDTIIVSDREWAQVGLFTNLSWNDINAVCPSGVCVDGGVLKSNIMTGWVWASTADMLSLLGTYGAVIEDPYSIPSVGEIGSTWAPAFFSAGWRATRIDLVSIIIDGLLRDESSDNGKTGGVEQSTIGSVDLAWAGLNHPKTLFQPETGAWFYRLLDSDSDGICDENRTVPDVCSPGPDGGDNCRSFYNPLQEDSDGDGCGDECFISGCLGGICINR